MKNAIVWFEIPVHDLARATKFYNAIFEIELEPLVVELDNVPYQLAKFPVESGVTGALIKASMFTPGTDGAVIYLNGGKDLDIVLNRVESAGGRVEMVKSSIGGEGYIAYLIDTEGNRIGLHSMS